MSLTLLEAAKAKLEGKRVEEYYKQQWHEWSGEAWHENWLLRIAPEPKKKVKILAWLTNETLVWKTEDADIPSHYKRVPSEDKEIEVEND